MAFATTELEQIYKRCFVRAMGLATSLLHSEDDARDVVQEVFVRLWEATGSAEVGNPDAFVYRSVRNACLNLIESMQARERLKRLCPLGTEAFDNHTEARIEAVRKAIATLLSERESEVVRAVFTEGHSYREAAAELGVSVSSVNKHVVNALRKLRKHFNTRKP